VTLWSIAETIAVLFRTVKGIRGLRLDLVLNGWSVPRRLRDYAVQPNVIRLGESQSIKSGRGP
jgi:hypothetical protein